MATEEQDMEVDRQVPTSGSNPIQARAVRISVRPPARFSATSDLALWLRRFELYAQQARIPTKQWVAELLSLLDYEPFRVVLQQGLDSDSENSDVKECLKAQYNPDGNKLEWQVSFNIGRKNQMNGSLNMF